MKKFRLAAFALVSALLALPACAETVDAEWWNVDFESPTPAGVDKTGNPAGGVTFTIGELGALTNKYNQAAGLFAPYTNGYWTANAADESYITNGVTTNIVDGLPVEQATNNYLRLDTQGEDLKWTPETDISNGVINLIDAYLLFVGSDSEPEAADFDPTNSANRVQTAIFLKNEIDEDTGETTNSVLCVYAYNNVTLKEEWMELQGAATIEDNTWHHVQVSINYNGDSPIVLVTVDDKPMTPRAGTAQITAANPQRSKAANRVREVCFRGTGAVDQFVGMTQRKIERQGVFAAEVYMDGEGPLAEEDATDTNYTRYETANIGDSGDGQTVTISGFIYDDMIPGERAASYRLDKIEIFDFSNNGVSTTYQCTYDEELDPDHPMSASPSTTLIDFVNDPYEGYQTGDFTVTAITDGAPDPTNTAVKIYFKSIGAYDANAVTKVGNNVTTNATVVRPADFTGGDTRTLSWTFPATAGANVLTEIAVENGATAAYDSTTRVATVSVTLAAALAADTTFVTATYGEGSYEGKNPTWIDNEDGTYVLGDYVAKIDGDPKPAYFTTLAAAVTAVEAEATNTTTILLVADIDLKGTNANVTIPAGKDVTLDLNGHSIAGDVDGDLLVLGTLTLTDSVEDSEGKIYAVARTGARGLIRVEGGTFNMAGGAIESIPDPEDPGENGSYAVVYRANSTVNVTGGTITAGWFCLSGNGKDGTGSESAVTISGGTLLSTADYAVYFPNAGTLTISDGAKISGAAGALAANNGTINIEGGEFLSSGTGDIGEGTDGTAGLGDVAVNIVGKYGTTTATISGGTFIAQQNAVVLAADENGATLAVSGGSFSQVVPDDYCADGYVPVTTADPVTGLYTVSKGAVQITIAGDVKTYGSIADAQAAAAAAEIADPVFTIVDELSEETVTLAYGDTLKIKVAEGGDITALEVVTSETDDAQYAYAVEDETDAETGVTTYSVARTVKSYDVEWIVDDVHTTNTWDYGATPIYGESNPTKAATETTIYAFGGWTPTVETVTGFASYTATWTETANTFTVTVTRDANATYAVTTNGAAVAVASDVATVYSNATVVVTATPAVGYTYEGVTLAAGWTLDGAAAVYTIAGIAANAAVAIPAPAQAAAVEPIAVTIGGDTDNPLPAGKEAITVDATTGFTLRFAAKQTGVTYILQSAATVDGTFADVEVGGTAVSVTPTEVNQVVELTDPDTTSTVKFFRVKVVVAE